MKTSSFCRVRAELAGGAGWQLGRWGAGITAGYATDENQSTLSPVIRRTRRVAPAATLGLVRQAGALLIGVYGTGRYVSETALLVGRFGSTLVQDLAGYRKVPSIVVSTTGADSRLREERLLRGGVSVGGAWAGSRWGDSRQPLRPAGAPDPAADQ